MKNLELQFDNLTSPNEGLPTLVQEAIVESVIQRFEICWDSLWKVLKRYLREDLGLPDVPNSPKPILRLAAENGILPTRTEVWLAYADDRISTSHDYSAEKALKTIRHISTFLRDAAALYTRISGQEWP